MIAVSFQLTPAQVRLLVAIAYEHYEGDLCLPPYKSARNDFVTTAQCLIRRGLVSHHDETPAYRATEAGMGLAKMVEHYCREVLEMVGGIEDRRKVWKPIAERDNEIRRRLRDRGTSK